MPYAVGAGLLVTAAFASLYALAGVLAPRLPFIHSRARALGLLALAMVAMLVAPSLSPALRQEMDQAREESKRARELEARERVEAEQRAGQLKTQRAIERWRDEGADATRILAGLESEVDGVDWPRRVPDYERIQKLAGALTATPPTGEAGYSDFARRFAALQNRVTEAEAKQRRATEDRRRARETPVTMEKYLSLKEGMSYAEAVVILGRDGTERSRSDIAGHTTVLYHWDGPSLSNMNAMFQNDKLISKAQFGLK